MAARYWVGGSGPWDAATTHWSATSGGAGGASVPTAADDAIFDISSGDGEILVSGARTCKTLTFTSAFAGQLGSTAGGSITVSGNVEFSANMVVYDYTHVSPMVAWTLVMNATGSIKSNGIEVACHFTMATAAIVVTFLDLIDFGPGTVTLTNATLDLNDKGLACGTFSSSNANARTLDWTNCDISCSNWTATTSTNFTLTINANSTLSLSWGGAGTFDGGGLSYPAAAFSTSSSSAQQLTITGANTWASLSITCLAKPNSGNHTIIFPNGVTQTVTGTLSLKGFNASSGGLLDIHSASAGAAATISKSSGTNIFDYLKVKDITFSGGITPAARWSTNVSGNTNITFGDDQECDSPLML